MFRSSSLILVFFFSFQKPVLKMGRWFLLFIKIHITFLLADDTAALYAAKDISIVTRLSQQSVYTLM